MTCHCQTADPRVIFGGLRWTPCGELAEVLARKNSAPRNFSSTAIPRGFVHIETGGVRQDPRVSPADDCPQCI